VDTIEGVVQGDSFTELLDEPLSASYSLVEGTPVQLGAGPYPHVSTTWDDGERQDYEDVRFWLRADGPTATVGLHDPGVNFHREREIPWNPDELVETVEIPPEDFVRAVVEAADELCSFFDEHHPEDDWRADHDPFCYLLDGARHLLDHLEGSITIDDYTLPLDADVVDGILYDPPAAMWRPRMSQYVADSGVVEREVERLAGRQDDEAATEAYEDLLGHDDAPVRRATAAALAHYPDVRARDALVQRRWSDHDVVMPYVVRALVAIDEATSDADERVGPDLFVDTLDFSKQPEIRVAAVKALAHYQGTEVVDALETAAQSDDNDAVRRTASRVLEESRSA
jgi:hypothetical protein